MNRKYDIVVVGAGAAGVVAACVAAEQGASVALVQKEAGVITMTERVGGQIPALLA